MDQGDRKNCRNEERIREQKCQLLVAAAPLVIPYQISEQSQNQKGEEQRPHQVVKVQDGVVREVLGVEVVAEGSGEHGGDGPTCYPEQGEDDGCPGEEVSPLHDSWRPAAEQQRPRAKDQLSADSFM